MLLGQLKESLDLLKNLKSEIEKKHAVYDLVCGRIREECTAEQNVKFVLWVTKNAAELSKVGIYIFICDNVNELFI